MGASGGARPVGVADPRTQLTAAGATTDPPVFCHCSELRAREAGLSLQLAGGRGIGPRIPGCRGVTPPFHSGRTGGGNSRRGAAATAPPWLCTVLNYACA
jgi:hypothetical protein